MAISLNICPVCFAVLVSIIGTSVSAQAYLNYSQPPESLPDSAYIGQVTKYPAFRPVRRQKAAAPVAVAQPAPAPQPPAQPEAENVILTVGGTVQIVPRARINGN